MFYYMMRKYRVDVLKNGTKRKIGELKLYEKLTLLIMIISAIASIILMFVFRRIVAALISYSFIFLGAIVLYIFQSFGKEEKWFNEEVIFPSGKKRIKNVVKLLDYFYIDYSKDEELDRLIEYANKESERLNFKNQIRDYIKGVEKYLIIPIVAIILTEYLKVDNLIELVGRSISLLIIGTILVFCIYSINIVFNDCNKYVEELAAFKRDMEQLKIFRNFEKKLPINENEEMK